MRAIITVALLAGIISSNAIAGGQVSEQNKLAAVVGPVGVHLKQCDRDIDLCEKVVGGIKKAIEKKRVDIEEYICTKCQDFFYNFPKIRDDYCVPAGKFIADFLTDTIEDILQLELACDDVRRCQY